MGWAGQVWTVGPGFGAVLAGPTSDIVPWLGMHTSVELAAATMPGRLPVTALGLTGHTGMAWRPGLTQYLPGGWMEWRAQGQLSAV